MKRLGFAILTSLITTFAYADPISPSGFSDRGLPAYDIAVDHEDIGYAVYKNKKHPVEWFIDKIPALDESLTGTCNEYWCYSHPEDLQLVGLNKSYVDAMSLVAGIKDEQGKILAIPVYEGKSITIGKLSIDKVDTFTHKVRMNNGPSITLDVDWGVMVAYYGLSRDNLDIAVLYGNLGSYCEENWLMVIRDHNFLSITELPFKCYNEHKSAKVIDDVLHITSGDDVFKYKLP